MFRPSLMIGVPYVYQKLYERIVDASGSLPVQLQIFFDKAIVSGKKYYTNIKKGIKNSMALKLKYEYYKKLF